jgi:hypothetical protein
VRGFVDLVCLDCEIVGASSDFYMRFVAVTQDLARPHCAAVLREYGSLGKGGPSHLRANEAVLPSDKPYFSGEELASDPHCATDN